jgi:hypothetical protein
MYDVNDLGEPTLTGVVPDLNPGTIVISADNLISADPEQGLEQGSDQGILLRDEVLVSLHFDTGVSIEPIGVALPAGYGFGVIVYEVTNGVSAALTMSLMYGSASMPLSTAKASIAGYAGATCSFQTNITGGTKASYLIKLTKV